MAMIYCSALFETDRTVLDDRPLDVSDIYDGFICTFASKLPGAAQQV